jgi:hypothetical protein
MKYLDPTFPGIRLSPGEPAKVANGGRELDTSREK